jgi:hypothetical protein
MEEAAIPILKRTLNFKLKNLTMKLYKNSQNAFTLINHENKVYSIQVFKTEIKSKFIGKGKFKVNGLLLKIIPDFLKTKCFELNKK